MIGWESGGCEPQKEDIINLKKVGVGVVLGSSRGQFVVGLGRGSTNVNQEMKVLLKEHTKGILQLITVKNMKTGAHNPLGLLKMRGN